MLPAIAPSMSASLGFGLRLQQRRGRHDLARLAVAALHHVDLAPGGLHRLPTGSLPIASMVVIFLPSAADTGVTQERIGWPSRCTVQAPHRATPQPNLVPVRPDHVAQAHSRGMSSGTSRSVVVPLMSRAGMENSFR